MLMLDDLLKLEKEKKLHGVYDVHEESYHAGPGISRSDLKLASKSAAHYLKKQTNNFPKSSALVFGSAFHTLVLEPQFFDERFAVFEKVDRRKTEVKEAIQNGLDPVSADDFQKLTMMRDSLMKKAGNLFKKGKAEQSCYWTDEKTGLLCKARTDLLIEDMGLCVDLKSCLDASEKPFRNSIVSYFYDLQAAHYLDGFSKTTGKNFDSFVFACVEKDYPFEVVLYRMSDAAVENAKDIQRSLLDRIYQAQKDLGEGKAAGYPTGFVEIDIPNWGYSLVDRIGSF